MAVLAGALLVGDSVRASLRALVEARLGRADAVVLSAGFFREQLAADIGATPIVMVQGFVTGQESGRRVGQVLRLRRRRSVLAIPRRRRRRARAIATRCSALRSRASWRVEAGDAVLVRVQRPSAIPLESVHGRKDDLGRTMRLVVRSVLAPGSLGEFSLRPQQGEVRAVFVPLARLQNDLEIPGRVNALLAGTPVPDTALSRSARRGSFAVRHNSRISASVSARSTCRARSCSSPTPGCWTTARPAAAAKALDEMPGVATPIFTYLANTIRAGSREVPYSLVTAIDLQAIAPGVADATGPAADCPERLGRARPGRGGRRRGLPRVLPVGGARAAW